MDVPRLVGVELHPVIFDDHLIKIDYLQYMHMSEEKGEGVITNNSEDKLVIVKLWVGKDGRKILLQSDEVNLF